jgi:hypothetical protein
MNSQAPCKTCAAIAALLKKAQAGSPQARVSKSALTIKAKPTR